MQLLETLANGSPTNQDTLGDLTKQHATLPQRAEMPPVEWYYAKDDKQLGPVSAAELKQLAISGQIGPEDLVWRDGLELWMPARKVKGLFEKGVPAPSAPPTKSTSIATPPPGVKKSGDSRPPTVSKGSRRHPLDLVLDFIRKQFPPAVVEITSKLFNVVGHYCLYVAMVVILIGGVICGIQDLDAGFFALIGGIILSLIVVVVLLVLQYAAHRFSGALERLNRSTEGRMNSTVFSDCFALLSMVVGLAALLGLSILALQTGDYILILPAVGLFIGLHYVAIVAVNLDTLNIRVDPEAGTSEEAMGILSFFAKVVLRVTPVAFGVGVVIETLSLLIAGGVLLMMPLIETTITQPETIDTINPLEPDLGVGVFLLKTIATFQVSMATARLILSASLPVIVFVVFLAYHLLVDLARAVLSLSDKSDRNGGHRDNGLV